jgi:hypothetical protein
MIFTTIYRSEIMNPNWLTPIPQLLLYLLNNCLVYHKCHYFTVPIVLNCLCNFIELLLMFFLAKLNIEYIVLLLLRHVKTARQSARGPSSTFSSRNDLLDSLLACTFDRS